MRDEIGGQSCVNSSKRVSRADAHKQSGEESARFERGSQGTWGRQRGLLARLRGGEKLFSRTTPRDCTGSSRDDARRSWAGIRLRNVEIVVVSRPGSRAWACAACFKERALPAQKFEPLGRDRPRRIGNWNACAACGSAARCRASQVKSAWSWHTTSLSVETFHGNLTTSFKGGKEEGTTTSTKPRS